MSQSAAGSWPGCCQPPTKAFADLPVPPLPFAAAEAEAVLTYGGLTVRAVFTFDRFGRVVRLRTRDALRRLSNGGYELGEWRVAYSGHMLFG